MVRECECLLANARCVRRGTEVLVGAPPLTAESSAELCATWPGGAAATPSGGAGGKARPAATRHAVFVPIEFVRPGDLAVTHWGRFRRVRAVLKRAYQGWMVGLQRRGGAETLWVTPEHPIATPLPPLPRPNTRRETVRRLRAKATPSEQILWQSLRDDRVAHRFRRQHPLGPFVVDFYCPSVRLVVEVDGSAHDEPDQRAHDRFRQEMIEEYHVVFMRVRSGDVERRPAQVIAAIAAAVERRAQRVCYDVCWVPARDLRVGTEVLYLGRRGSDVISSTLCEETVETVLNLVVEDDNSYLTKTSTVRGCCEEALCPPHPRLRLARGPSGERPLPKLGEGDGG
jgi:very-short-patch-repair endonuclease